MRVQTLLNPGAGLSGFELSLTPNFELGGAGTGGAPETVSNSFCAFSRETAGINGVGQPSKPQSDYWPTPSSGLQFRPALDRLM